MVSLNTQSASTLNGTNSNNVDGWVAAWLLRPNKRTGIMASTISLLILMVTMPAMVDRLSIARLNGSAALKNTNNLRTNTTAASAILLHSSQYQGSLGRLSLDEAMDKEKDDPNPESLLLPRVAWLMTYPNSGTTYTLSMIQQYTNTTTATNYGAEQTVHGETIPVHSTWDQGPFVRHPEMELPPNYIITKTHCSGHKMSPNPLEYVETQRSFEVSCRLASKMVNNDTKVSFMYGEHIPQRAIHLIRNPFDNIVARLHMEQKRWQSRPDRPGYDDYVRVFNSTQMGFQAWCHHRNKLSDQFSERHNSMRVRFIDDELWKLAKDVPCRGEFFRYVWWHNLAIATIRRMKVPVHTFFYEDYTNRYEDTAAQLLDFLELTPAKNAMPPEFITGKHYVDYFEPDQRTQIKTLVHALASPETWQLVAHYFDFGVE